MKIKNSQKRSLKKTIVLSITALLSVVAIVGLVFFVINRNDTVQTQEDVRTIDLNPPSEDQLSDGERIKKESLSQDSSAPPESTVDIFLTASSVNDDSYRIRVFINKVTNEGECSLTFTSPGGAQLAVTNVDIQSLPNGATCKGFDVPLSDLQSSKTWTATVIYTGNNISGQVSGVVSL